ncbi:MAG: hypothetical protein BHW65_06290 [Verrucomicrobia bacterium CAG:312_58_20]|nr:MAG: hypothetical protein BHW65_06290 [Verrucomicrobia bacterium CAG:312_58_20]
MRDFQARLDYRAVPFLGAAPCRFSSAGVFAEAFFAAIPQALQIARGFCGIPHAQGASGLFKIPPARRAKKRERQKSAALPAYIAGMLPIVKNSAARPRGFAFAGFGGLSLRAAL